MVQPSDIIQKFGKKLRVRVNGILKEDDRILMVKHRALGPKGYLWSPPGGGMIFGQSAEENLIREFSEETGLQISVNEFLFIHEFLAEPLHAIELFFNVHKVGGKLIQGLDPEMERNKQIIEEVAFLSWNDINRIDPQQKHQVFQSCSGDEDLKKFNGYLYFGKG